MRGAVRARLRQTLLYKKLSSTGRFYEKLEGPQEKTVLPMIGYEFLLSRIPLRMPPLNRPARVRPVTRIERMPDLLAVPRHVAPADGSSILEHVLFALKHEGTWLAVLHEALKLVPAGELQQALAAHRGRWLRGD